MAPAKVIYQHTDLFDPPLLFQLLNQDLLRSAELFFCGADRQPSVDYEQVHLQSY